MQEARKDTEPVCLREARTYPFLSLRMTTMCDWSSLSDRPRPCPSLSSLRLQKLAKNIPGSPEGQPQIHEKKNPVWG